MILFHSSDLPSIYSPSLPPLCSTLNPLNPRLLVPSSLRLLSGFHLTLISFFATTFAVGLVHFRALSITFMLFLLLLCGLYLAYITHQTATFKHTG